jgi:uncharacterized protein YcfL
MYLSGFLGIILFFLIIFFISIQKPPTCFDNKQNQDETGIDCGGVCAKLCTAEQTPLTVLWARTSKTQDGLYNAVAYVQNSNLNGFATNVYYHFYLYDKDGVRIYERRNKEPINIAPRSVVAIFEPGLFTGKAVSTRIVFDFDGDFVWYKSEEAGKFLSVADKQIYNASTSPKLLATIKNDSLLPYNNVEAVAIIYDGDGTARQFSRTILDQIPPQKTVTAPFTWPEPFDFLPARTEIVLKPEYQLK